MGFTRFSSPVVRVGGRTCLSLDARCAALTAAIYTMLSCLLVCVLYSWRLAVNMQHPGYLQDVYYGVQISYIATLVTHVSLALLSVVLVVGVLQERSSLVTPWIVANITFMALEAVCCVYSNVLRDHINKRFDAFSKAEMVFFLSRAFFNIISIAGVIRFLRNLRVGVTYKDPEAIEL